MAVKSKFIAHSRKAASQRDLNVMRLLKEILSVTTHCNSRSLLSKSGTFQHPADSTIKDSQS